MFKMDNLPFNFGKGIHESFIRNRLLAVSYFFISEQPDSAEKDFTWFNFYEYTRPWLKFSGCAKTKSCEIFFIEARKLFGNILKIIALAE